MSQESILNNSTTSNNQIISFFNELSTQIYEDNKAKGFWENPILDKLLKLEDYLHTTEETPSLLSKKVFEIVDLVKTKMPNGRNKAEAIALMHSELSEALEGLRKNEMSDKIPEFTAEEEELADLLVRVFDHAGGQNLRIGQAFIAKILYNRTRAYKHGKAF